jgi:probable F420-dependent oxidoreductase
MFPTGDSIRPDELGAEVEARGFESLWFPEHTHIPTSRRSPFPGGGELPPEYSRSHDPFVALTAAAMNTKRIRLGTGICLIIERDTITTAKAVASLDVLSNGRFVFGIGGGWNREEMEHHGTDYTTRFAKLEEQVAAFKTIWTEDEAEFHGRHVDFDPIWSWPKPAQKPHPPIVLGGGTRYTRQRVVDHCDGWMPIGRDDEAVLRGIEDLRHRAERAGRAMDTISINVFGATPNREVLDRYAEAGVGRAVLLARPEGRDLVLPRLDRYATLLAG